MHIPLQVRYQSNWKKNGTIKFFKWSLSRYCMLNWKGVKDRQTAKLITKGCRQGPDKRLCSQANIPYIAANTWSELSIHWAQLLTALALTADRSLSLTCVLCKQRQRNQVLICRDVQAGKMCIIVGCLSKKIMNKGVKLHRIPWTKGHLKNKWNCLLSHYTVYTT